MSKPHPPTALRPLLLTAAVIGAFAFTGGGPALANHVSCGDTITADTKLDSDLVNCPNNGLVIDSNNVKLDLNGHTIDGDDKLVKPCPRNEACDLGIDNTGGHTGVKITDGKIREFGFGVLLVEAKRNRLDRLASSLNHFNGITIVASPRTSVLRSSATRNGLPSDFPGLAIFESRDLRIERNTLSANADLGLFAIDVDDSLIKRNTLSRNPELGAILEGNGNEFARNRMVRNGGGIAYEGNHNEVTRNTVIDGLGISLEGGNENLIAHNTVRADRDGILVGPDYGKHGEDTRVVGNRVRGAGRDGVRVGKQFTDTLVKRNHVSHAGDDGIDVRRAATTLIGNRAVRNHDLGIKAVTGATDGGDNLARDNGDRRQCRNVACG